MEQLTDWKIITLLLGMVSAGVIYWRKLKDKKDEDLAKDIINAKKEAKDGRAAIYKHLDSNHEKVLAKLDEVLTGQHTIDLKIQRAFNGIENNSNNIEQIMKKQEKGLEDLNKVKQTQAVDVQWKKRVEDKLKMS